MKKIIAIVIILCLTLSLFACTDPNSPEAQLERSKQAVEDLKEAAEYQQRQIDDLEERWNKIQEGSNALKNAR